MQLGRVRFVDDQCEVFASIAQVMRTQTLLERSRGLLGRELAEDQGLWIIPCNSVHSLGMRYPIDLVYLDKTRKIRKIVATMKPFRASLCPGAHSTLELPAGRAAALGLRPGLQMEWAHD